MQSFQSLLQTLLTLLAVVSEYTLIFDRWILIAPTGPAKERRTLSDAQIKRSRWFQALRTSLAYALFEPLGCWLISVLPGNVIFWCIMACALHFGFISAAVGVKIECLTEARKEHDDLCVAAHVQSVESTRWTGPGKVDVAAEKTKEISHGQRDDGEQIATSEHNIDQQQQVTCVKTHELGREFRLSTYPPIFTAALSNAGLILYCRYLTIPDSAVWRNGFVFGWTVIALLIVFIFGITKFDNYRMHEITWRPHMPALRTRDCAQVLSCWALIMVVRAQLRAILSQTAFTPTEWSASPSALIVKGEPVPHNLVTYEDGMVKPPPDPMWQKIHFACNILVIIGNIGYWGYQWRQMRARRNSSSS